MPSSKSSSSSRRSSVTEQITKQLEAHTLLSNVTVNIDDLALSVKLNIKVDQRVQVKIPLKALVTYENAEIVPGKEDNEKVKGDNSSSDSDAGSEVSDNKLGRVLKCFQVEKLSFSFFIFSPLLFYPLFFTEYSF